MPSFVHKPVLLSEVLAGLNLRPGARIADGTVGGARVIEQLRPIMENFSMFAVRETVMFTKAPGVFDESGKLLDESFSKKVDGLLKSLIQSAEIMKAYPRAKRP